MPGDKAHLLHHHGMVIWKHPSIGCAIVEAKTHLILQCNQQFATQLGYTTQELINVHVDKVTDSAYRGTGTTELLRVEAGELEYYHQRKYYLTKSGQRKLADVYSFPIEDSNELDHFFSTIVFLQDLNDGQHIEEMEKRMAMHERVIAAMVGRDQNISTTVSGNVAGGDVSNGTPPNKTAIILALILAAVISLVVMAVRRGLLTIGKQPVEANQEPNQ